MNKQRAEPVLPEYKDVPSLALVWMEGFREGLGYSSTALDDVLKKLRGEQRLARDLGATEMGSARDIMEAAIEAVNAANARAKGNTP